MYVVPGVPLLRQPAGGNACWFVAARMLVRWRRAQPGCPAGLKDPAEDPAWEYQYLAGNTLSRYKVAAFAKALGLAECPPACTAPGGIADLLRRVGPLWVNGVSHVVVVAGVCERSGTVQVLDP